MKKRILTVVIAIAILAGIAVPVMGRRNCSGRSRGLPDRDAL